METNPINARDIEIGNEDHPILPQGENARQGERLLNILRELNVAPPEPDYMQEVQRMRERNFVPNVVDENRAIYSCTAGFVCLIVATMVYYLVFNRLRSGSLS